MEWYEQQKGPQQHADANGAIPGCFQPGVLYAYTSIDLSCTIHNSKLTAHQSYHQFGGGPHLVSSNFKLALLLLLVSAGILLGWLEQQ
jgi:hypothetical protein